MDDSLISSFLMFQFIPTNGEQLIKKLWHFCLISGTNRYTYCLKVVRNSQTNMLISANNANTGKFNKYIPYYVTTNNSVNPISAGCFCSAATKVEF